MNSSEAFRVMNSDLRMSSAPPLGSEGSVPLGGLGASSSYLNFPVHIESQLGGGGGGGYFAAPEHVQQLQLDVDLESRRRAEYEAHVHAEARFQARVQAALDAKLEAAQMQAEIAQLQARAKAESGAQEAHAHAHFQAQLEAQARLQAQSMIVEPCVPQGEGYANVVCSPRVRTCTSNAVASELSAGNSASAPSPVEELGSQELAYGSKPSPAASVTGACADGEEEDAGVPAPAGPGPEGPGAAERKEEVKQEVKKEANAKSVGEESSYASKPTSNASKAKTEAEELNEKNEMRKQKNRASAERSRNNKRKRAEALANSERDLKSKVRDLQQSLSYSESLNRSLYQDNQKLRNQVTFLTDSIRQLQGLPPLSMTGPHVNDQHSFQQGLLSQVSHL